jgi:hypothetical protein
MPRYLIERTFSVGEEQMPDIGKRSRQIALDGFPDIAWEHSHVVVDEAGTVRTFCMYSGPDPDTLRKHAALLGDHQIDRIHEVAGDVTPADFPLD